MINRVGLKITGKHLALEPVPDLGAIEEGRRSSLIPEPILLSMPIQIANEIKELHTKKLLIKNQTPISLSGNKMTPSGFGYKIALVFEEDWFEKVSTLREAELAMGMHNYHVEVNHTNLVIVRAHHDSGLRLPDDWFQIPESWGN